MSKLSPEQILRLVVLSTISECAGNQTKNTVNADDVLNKLPPGSGMDLNELQDQVSLLKSSGLVDAFISGAGLTSVVMLAQGKELVTQFRRNQENPVARLKQLQDDYLRWLYAEIEINERHVNSDHYLATQPRYLGQLYTAKEVEKAGSRLREGGFISGPGTWGSNAPIWPELSAKARLYVEDGRSVHDRSDATSPPQTVTTHIGDNANVSINSSHISQTMTVNPDWAEPVTAALAAITQALATFPTEERVETQTLIKNVELAVQSKDRSKAKTALVALAGFLGATSSNALGTMLAAQLTQLIPSLAS